MGAIRLTREVLVPWGAAIPTAAIKGAGLT